MAVAGLRALEQSYFDLRWHLDPVLATQAGVTAHDERLGRFGPDGLRSHLAALKSLAQAAEQLAAGDVEEEIDRTAMLNDARVVLHRFERERPQARNPEFWLTHLLAGLHALLRPAGRTLEQRARALVARMEDAPAFLDDARAGLTEPVRLFADTALRVGAAGLDLVNEIRTSFAAQVPAHAGALAAAADRAAAALTAFGHDCERWLETGTDAFALGEDGFNFRLHYEHALRATAPELWRYGLHLKDEVEADLARRAASLDAGRHWSDVADRLRGDHPAAAALVGAYRGAMARARAFVEERALAPVPDAPLDVVPTPAFMRPLIPFAAYDSPGPYASDRTGLFYVTAPDPALPAATQERLLRDHCEHELAATALHEGYPGHHLQLLAAQAQPSHVRKNVVSAVTVEGWALYCEDMMAEEGFYASAEQRFFQRLHLLWRAVRILLDVGLHTRGMPFAEAVDRLVDAVHVDRSHAEADVRRCCALPAYQLCYAVGRRELLRLRDDYRAARGGAFTLRGFHDDVLRYGGLPVTLTRWGLGLGE